MSDEWAILRLEVDLAANRAVVTQARQVIADSRRWLDAYRRNNPLKQKLMKCLLCGEEGIDLFRLAFQARNLLDFRRENPAIDLNAKLAGFGVCPDCTQRHNGQRKRVIVALNRAIAREMRVLH